MTHNNSTMTETNQSTRRRIRANPIFRLLLVAVILALVGASCSPGVEGVTGAGTDTTGAPSTTKPFKLPSVDLGVTIEWVQSELSEANFGGDLLWTESGFLALRFAHGAQAWTSPDGISWETRAVDLETQSGPEQIAVYPVTRGGPGFVALGADPATPEAEGSTTVIWTSVDGLSWQRHEPQLEQPQLGVFAETVLLSVVGGPNGLVLTGRLDRSEGIDEHRFLLWTSSDALEWTLIEDPFPAGAHIRDIRPTPNGFITYGWVEGSDVPDHMWWSETGESWEEVSTDFLPPRGGAQVAIFADDPVQGFAMWGDRVLTAANTDSGIGLWVSADTHNWMAVPTGRSLDSTDELVLGVYSVAAGPAGIAVVGAVDVRQPQQDIVPLRIEQEDRTLVVDSVQGSLTVTDNATGEVLLLVADAEKFGDVILDDGDSIIVTDPGSAEQLMVITSEVWIAALEKAGLLQGPPPEEFTTVLWFSPDGEHWSRIVLEETFGINEFPTEVVVGENSLILQWSGFLFLDDQESFEDDPPAVLWVGLLSR